MKKRYRLFILVICSSVLLIRCSKKSDPLITDTIADYTNLAVGKYITYRLDSFTYVNFGQKDTTVKYLAKDVVEAAITDNTGRPGWRVVRYLNDTAALGTWTAVASFAVTATNTVLEVIDDNLRYQKLRAPIKDDFSWKGNSYIDTYSESSDVTYLDNWDYTYANCGQPYSLGTTTVDSTITVNQRDEILGDPGNVDSYSERNLSVEVYGRNIGLVYKNFLHWIFQARNSTYPNGFYEGYGITLRMVDHN